MSANSWAGLYGHEDAVRRFRQAFASGKLASSYLFVSPSGVGKRTFAELLAKALLCRNRQTPELIACGQCDACKLCDAGTHPDILKVARPAEKSSIPLELLIGADDKRMREGLCHDLHLKPYLGPYRVAILDDADYLGVDGANCLLKTLEEPPPGSLLILISTSAALQLSTIRSRCQSVHFGLLPNAALIQLMLDKGWVADEQAARQLAELAQGSMDRARLLSDTDVRDFRTKLHAWLSRPPLDSPAMSTDMIAFVESAGKEAPKRRARLLAVIGFAMEYLQSQLRVQLGQASAAHTRVSAAAHPGGPTWPERGDLLPAAIDRCVEASFAVERFAHQNAIIECWLDDLGQIAATGLAVARL